MYLLPQDSSVYLDAEHAAGELFLRQVLRGIINFMTGRLNLDWHPQLLYSYLTTFVLNMVVSSKIPGGQHRSLN
jgi:hypothetical protein